MRTYTTYQHPSITDRIATARTVDDLAVLREVLQELFAEGKLAPAGKTLRAWHERLWERVGQLIFGAATDEEACYVYNATLRWEKPAGLQEALAAMLAAKVAAMPNRVERLSCAGVVVEGVSTPAQRERAEKIQCGWMPVMFRPDGSPAFTCLGLTEPGALGLPGRSPANTERISHD